MAFTYELIEESRGHSGCPWYAIEVNSVYDNPEDALHYADVLKKAFPNKECEYYVRVTWGSIDNV